MVWALNYGFGVEGFNGFDETFMSYTSLNFDFRWWIGFALFLFMDKLTRVNEESE